MCPAGAAAEHVGGPAGLQAGEGERGRGRGWGFGAGSPLRAAPQAPSVSQPPIQVYGLEGRYATALYSAATKQKKLEQVEKELGRVWVRLLGAPRPEVTQGLGGRGLPAAVRTLLHAVRLARPACALRSTPRAPPRPGELLEGASAPKGASSLRAPLRAAVSLPICSLLSSVLA